MGLIQHATNVMGAGTQLQVTFGSSTTAGNCLIASIGSSANVSSVTTNGTAENWTQAGKESTEPVTIANLWFDWNTGGSQTVIDVNLNSSGDAGADLFEWNGMPNTNPLDKTSFNPNASGSSWTSGTTATLSQANEVFFGNVASSGSPTGPSSPWTNESQLSFNGQTLLSGYQQVSANTGLAYSGTFGIGTASNAGVMSLKLGSGITVNLPLATINAAAFNLKPSQYVALPLATVNAAAFNVTPGINLIVHLPLATINASAFNVTPREPALLAIAIATRPGVDPYAGTAYTEGISVFDTSSNGQIYSNLNEAVLSFVTQGVASQNNSSDINSLGVAALDIRSGITSTPGDQQSGVFMYSQDAPINPFAGSSFAGFVAQLVQLNGVASVPIPMTAPSVSGADGIAIVNALISAGIFLLCHTLNVGSIITVRVRGTLGNK